VTRLIGLDPSMVSPGVAEVRDRRLVRAARLRMSGDAHTTILDASPRLSPDDLFHRLTRIAPSMTDALSDAARCRATASAILDWVYSGQGLDWDLVTETPQVYAPGRRGAGPPNDLIPMALVIGGVALACPGQVSEYHPGQWTGQLAKSRAGDPRDSPRGARIWSRLDEGEREVAAGCLQHDAWDAIGVLLHHLGRLAPRRGRKPCT